MELLIYPNLLSIEPLTKEEKENLERTLIYFLGLLNNLKKLNLLFLSISSLFI